MTRILLVIERISNNQLSKKPKVSSKSLISFLKSAENYRHFEQKDEPRSLSICNIIDSKRLGSLNV